MIYSIEDKLALEIDSKASFIIDRLKEHGYEAFIVGGCVRDVIMGKSPNDWDITTSARPEIVEGLFEKTIPTGIEHGTVTVFIDSEMYEITTYRIDGEYNDMRRPDNVEFSEDIIDDLSRRDFTVNAMAFNKYRGLIDEYGGVVDIENKIIKCVGNPEERFNEDALRIMRAIRFSSKLNFDIEQKTYYSMKKNASNLMKISKERINKELEEIIDKNPLKLALFNEIKISKELFYNDFDMYRLKKSSLAKDLSLKKAIIFKNYSEDELKRLMKSLRYSNKNIDETLKIHNIIRNLSKFKKDLLIEEKKDLRIFIKNILRETSDINIAKKSICGIFIEENELFLEKNINVEVCFSEINDIIDRGECFSISQLKLNGNDLIEKNIATGRDIGLILDKLCCHVIYFPNDNEKEKLIKLSIEYMK